MPTNNVDVSPLSSALTSLLKSRHVPSGPRGHWLLSEPVLTLSTRLPLFRWSFFTWHSLRRPAPPSCPFSPGEGFQHVVTFSAGCLSRRFASPTIHFFGFVDRVKRHTAYVEGRSPKSWFAVSAFLALQPSICTHPYVRSVPTSQESCSAAMSK